MTFVKLLQCSNYAAKMLVIADSKQCSSIISRVTLLGPDRLVDRSCQAKSSVT